MNPTNPLKQKLHDLRARGMKVKIEPRDEEIRVEVTDDKPYPVFRGSVAHFMLWDFDERNES